MKHKKNNSREEKPSQTFTGIYCQRRGAGWVEPDGSAHADITIHRGQELGAKNGDRVEFEVTGRRHKKGSFEGRILSIFDAESTFLAEQALLPEKHLLRAHFPPRSGQELKALAMRETSAGYRDLRDALCVTIDPVDAKDFDDAVSIEKTGDGYRLGVYIADVTHYVPENSLIDKEAFLRGTSTYLPWGVIPMLPPALSEDLCSLKPGEDRRAAACVMTVNKSGKVLQADIFRCFIINKRRLNYQEAQGILDGKVQAEARLIQSLKTMKALSNILKTKRLAEGALDFDLPEVKIDFKGGKLPVSIRPYEKFTTNSMIEEFMLLANQVVAGRLTDMDQGAIYRIHGKPEEEPVQNLYAFMKANGFKVPPYEGVHTFKRILEIVHGTPHEKPVHMMVLRAMPKAKYSAKNIGHFGLAFDLYTHFTSPIRRYPDLLVHRLLFQDTNRKKRKSIQELESISQKCSEAEEKSMKAERDATSLCACTIMQKRLGEVFEGRVSGIIESGIFVELTGQGVDGMVHVSRLGRDYFYFDPPTMTMVGRSSGQRIRLGQTMKVKLHEVTIALRRIDLALAE